MKILYPKDGEIFYAVYDADWFRFTHSTNVPLSILSIAEIDPVNKGICIDLVRTCGRVDVNGRGKYYVSDGVLYEREGWQEHVEDLYG